MLAEHSCSILNLAEAMNTLHVTGKGFASRHLVVAHFELTPHL